MKTFYLGAHHPDWLEKTDVPLFVSRASFYGSSGKIRKTFPRARGPWALDSGGFSELKLHGRWTVSPEQYSEDVQTLAAEIGRLKFASIQDLMCEADQLARTGLKIADHQRLSTDSYLELVDLAPELPWLPVLQGWTIPDYMRHVDLYAKSGVKLEKLPLVGLGSVCRRQDTIRISFLIQDLASLGFKLHAFGYKTEGLLFKPTRDAIVSADSMSWSKQARYSKGKCCVRGKHPETQKCQNCLAWALEWRANLLNRIAEDDAATRR